MDHAFRDFDQFKRWGDKEDSEVKIILPPGHHAAGLTFPACSNLKERNFSFQHVFCLFFKFSHSDSLELQITAL